MSTPLDTSAAATAPELEIVLTPLKAALVDDRRQTLDVLVRLVARRAAPLQRTPLSLSLVIDRSGSMRGHKLQAAKACAADLVARLDAADEVGIVVYDDAADTLLPLMPAGPARQQIDMALAAFESGGSTNLHGGWLAGAQQVAPRTGPGRLCRVVLLSDGLANNGETDPSRICEQVRELAHSGVTTTTVGLGEGFNEALMTEMANAGQGNALYGYRAEDLAEAFESEIGLPSHLAWRDVRLLTGSATSRWALLNDYQRNADGQWALPSIAAGAEAWACFSVPIDSAVCAQARSRQGKAFHVTVQALDGNGQPCTFKASLPALPVVDAARWHAMGADELVQRRLTELRAARLQRRARAAADDGNWAEAERMLNEVEALAADHPWIQQTVQQTHALLTRRDRMRFGKEMLYASRSMSQRLAEADEGAEYSIEVESSKAAYLRRKGYQGRSSGG
jgi:Ca-activated chloride channel family protein